MAPPSRARSCGTRKPISPASVCSPVPSYPFRSPARCRCPRWYRPRPRNSVASSSMWTCKMYRASEQTNPFIGSTAPTSVPRRIPSTSSFIPTLGATLFMALVSSGPCQGRVSCTASRGYQRLSAFTGNIGRHLPAAGNTLGARCNQVGDWPHEQVKEALQKLYKFCSDYPGIRHAGNPAGVLRNLATRDMTLASLLLLSFSGYLSPTLDERVVLGL
jgi:hypothetical protein